jgi:hypothetical protein
MTASPLTVTCDDVISSELSVPVTVKSLPIVTSFGRPIVKVSPLTTTSTSFAVPLTTNVSELSIDEVLLPSLNVQALLTVAELTAVTRPFASTVITGTVPAHP